VIAHFHTAINVINFGGEVITARKLNLEIELNLFC